jgi:hypothetical protein
MLEHVPGWLGHLLQRVRAGHEKLVAADPSLSLGDARIDLASPAFADGGRLPPRFTADGEGVSPPLVWGPAPPGTAALALIAEDPDAPAAQPLVHAIVWGLAPAAGRLEEGAIADGARIGRGSFGHRGWLPPDPPTGHGAHDYVFQLFALSEPVALADGAGRTAFVEAIAGRVLGTGLLTGTYSRGEEASASSGAAGATA